MDIFLNTFHREKITLPVGLVNDFTGSQKSLLLLDSDGDEVDEAVVADETGEGLVEKLVLLGEVVLWGCVHQVLQVHDVGVVVQAGADHTFLPGPSAGYKRS